MAAYKDRGCVTPDIAVERMTKIEIRDRSTVRKETM